MTSIQKTNKQIGKFLPSLRGTFRKITNLTTSGCGEKTSLTLRIHRIQLNAQDAILEGTTSESKIEISKPSAKQKQEVILYLPQFQMPAVGVFQVPVKRLYLDT